VLSRGVVRGDGHRGVARESLTEREPGNAFAWMFRGRLEVEATASPSASRAAVARGLRRALAAFEARCARDDRTTAPPDLSSSPLRNEPSFEFEARCAALLWRAAPRCFPHARPSGRCRVPRGTPPA
jgi:hypothetical protein